jgi:hypothetical protein
VAELDFIDEVKAENAVQARAARPRSAHAEHRVCVRAGPTRGVGPALGRARARALTAGPRAQSDIIRSLRAAVTRGEEQAARAAQLQHALGASEAMRQARHPSRSGASPWRARARRER